MNSIKESGVVNEAFDMSVIESAPKSGVALPINSLPVARQFPAPLPPRPPEFSMEPNQGTFVERLEIQDMPYDGSQNLDIERATVRSI